MQIPSVIVFGTGNRKKGEELAELFAATGIVLKTLADFDKKLDVVEDGHSFAENAVKKAKEQAVFLEHWVLAEDSGLSVDALNGRPGIYSARFSGEKATDARNNELLLEKMKNIPDSKRTARYTCHIALSDASGRILAESEDICCGIIRHHLHGANGFGYDPLFEIPEYHKTFGELDPIIKKVISHRARAVRKMLNFIRNLIHASHS
ncbi:MAG: RdgB/HAM1 family non-canonical purine NTP pyrophosphatase [Planctomycetaceae bacterium]|jgi:XTP/dITP diphosphohydrolase|nr:RdgB/HAM1 family non-canonical purine NTP pyrophosphatase [Planctomycetaceae bacterium]